MRIVMLSLLFILMSSLNPAFAQETQKTDVVVDKMAFKFVRGITNIATCIVELPKQMYLTVRDKGAIGYATGPVKGIGMTLYRAFSGAADTAFFVVPQPGYYDAMINPDFVWKGWEEYRPADSKPKEMEPLESSDAGKEK